MSVYNNMDTAIEGLNNLLDMDYETLSEREEFDNIEFLIKVAETIAIDYESSEFYDPAKLHIIGKHLEEFGKTLKDASKEDLIDELLLMQENEDDKSFEICGQTLTLTNRPKYTYPDDERLTLLERQKKSTAGALKNYKNKLRKNGEVSAINNFSVSISKS